MVEIDENVDTPIQALDCFVELETIQQMVADLQTEYQTNFEKSYETYSIILSRYQEQPHLLNPHLPALTEQLFTYIRSKDIPVPLSHAVFKYLYQFSKVRTYKVLLKFMPHEINDLAFVLEMLERQNVEDSENWESRYMLLFWLSVLVLNPFEIARFDTHVEDGRANTADRIFNVCQINSSRNDTCADIAAFLTAKYLIRTDIKGTYLPKYFEWVIESNTNVHFGQLSAIANILKHGKREDLLSHAPKLQRWLLSCDLKTDNNFRKNKYFVKIIQRLGLVFLKPRLAVWRYQRGSRSLTAKLADANTTDLIEFRNEDLLSGEIDEDMDVPAEIEEIIEELLQTMRHASGEIRWSAAKGIGRIASRLPKDFGDEVVGSIIEILNPLEPNEAWHGACLAVAELAKRGLLLPYRLETMVPLLLQALVYDELKGYMSVGTHIRDAACYVCWAFARAYDPVILKPFVNEIAAGLLITAVYDREVNCRRAASAAFQECVGRLRTFPYGIDILTRADFFSVGMRTNSYLEISDYIAQYNDYSYSLIGHLLERKVNHWDTAIRELTAKTLHKLAAREPDYISNDILPKLFVYTTSIDVNQRHGAILAIGEIVLKLKELEAQNGSEKIYVNQSLNDHLNNLVIGFQKRDQFRGMSGEMMSQSCCDFIKNCSKAGIQATDECIDSWQSVIDASLVKNSAPIRDAAVVALTELSNAYYNRPERTEKNVQILAAYLNASKEDLWEFVRIGNVLAIAALPDFILRLKTKEVLLTLIANALTHADRKQFFHEDIADSPNTVNWAESRRDCVKSLTNVIQTLGFDVVCKVEVIDGQSTLDTLFDCFLLTLNEYTVDNRGDIGAWVREATMNALYKLVVTMPQDLLSEIRVHEVICGLLQQSVEKIDRTRALAGKLFCKIIYNKPSIPFIKHEEFIKNVFPEDYSNILWLHAAHTFPLFCALLELPEYTERLITGLIASIGQLTESLIKHSSNSLIDFLQTHPEHKQRICDIIIEIFKKNLLNERVSCPLLNFLNIIISSGAIDDIVLDPATNFSSEVFRLTKLEIKGHKKLYKVVSSINVFCQLLQVKDLNLKVLAILTVFLGLPHVHIRKTTAAKLYEALILHADACDIPEEKLDDISSCLLETDWGLPINEIRLIRNDLCTLLNIKSPVVTSRSQPK